MFSIDRMSVSKTKIKPEQAKLYQFNDRLNIFTDYTVYDNIVMVSHSNLLSIYDLNSKVCKEKSWRHIA